MSIIWLQKSASIQKRTSPLKFDYFRWKIQNFIASNLSTQVMLGMDNSELLMLVESPDQLKAKVDEALRVSTEQGAADELKLIQMRRREPEIHHE